MDLSGKVAIVTGASRGIGRAIALEMAKAGANVALNCLCEDNDSHETEDLLRTTGRRVMVCYGDVADYQMVESNVAAVFENFGRLELAIANAAYSEREAFCSADLNAFRHTVNVTMWGAFHLFRVAANHMVSQGNGGALLAISSPHAFIAGACPILVGRLFQTTENWNLILLLFAGVFLLGAICWLFVNPQTGIRLAERELCAT